MISTVSVEISLKPAFNFVIVKESWKMNQAKLLPRYIWRQNC